MSRWGRWFALLLAGVLAALLSGCGLKETNEPAGQEVKGLLYKIKYEDIAMYLLGSIHIGNENMHPFGQAIRQGMEEADTFVFECDTTSREAAAAGKLAMALPEGDMLYDLISPECYALLEEVCRLKGYPIGQMNRLRPWAAMVSLSMEATAAELGVKNARKAMELGVERNVMAFARERGRRIVYLETTQEQLNTLDRLSLPLQEHLLQEQLRIILDPSIAKGLDAYISQWPAFWNGGDAQAFADRYQQGYGDIIAEDELAWTNEYHAALVTRRNLLMADRLEAMMREEGPGVYFVTIGLLHFVLPEDSVLKHMESRGYQVEYCN